MDWQQLKRRLVFSLYLFWILCGLQCSKESPHNEDHFFPDAVIQNIDVVQLARAFAAAEQIEDLRGLAVARNGIIVAE